MCDLGVFARLVLGVMLRSSAIALAITPTSVLLAENGSASLPFPGLQVGSYVIKRTLFHSPHITGAPPEIQRLLPTTDKPIVEYYQFEKSPAGTILRIVEADGTSAKRCIIGIGVHGAWAMEESGNRVTLITESVTSENALDVGGPVRGLLKFAVDTASAFETMGLNTVHWARSAEGWVPSSRTGEPLRLVETHGDTSTVLLNCVPTVNGRGGTSFQIHIDTSGYMNEVTISNLDAKLTATPNFNLSIIKFNPTVGTSPVEDAWRSFANPITLILTYRRDLNQVTFIDKLNGRKAMSFKPRVPEPQAHTMLFYIIPIMTIVSCIFFYSMFTRAKS